MQLSNHDDSDVSHYGVLRSGGVLHRHDDSFYGGVYISNHDDGMHCHDDGTIVHHDEFSTRC